MLDFFTIFSKGGIVLWCFQSTSQIFTPSVNALIRSVILQERSAANNSFDHGSLSLKYKLDNEFDLIFVVAFQKILQLSYVDKFLNDVHLEFRDMYKNELQEGQVFGNFDFSSVYKEVLAGAEEWARLQQMVPKQMRSFEESLKSKKTVSSMIERPHEQKQKQEKVPELIKVPDSPPLSPKSANGELDEETLAQNRMRLAQKLGSPNAKKKAVEKQKSPKPKKAGKAPTQWDLGGTNKDVANLERTKDRPSDSPNTPNYDARLIGQMVGGIKDLEVESSDEEEEEEEESEVQMQVSKEKKSGGMFSIFKGLVGNKSLSRESMQPALEKMCDLLIAKNVAADIAKKLCESVAVKLDGKVIGTFDGVASVVKNTLNESLIQILSPRRRVDILRDALESQRKNRPYVMTFCGVNGVGKSTNLAKICFWLIENNFRVLIAACDTFRAGAVEQLRTHMRHLNALHSSEMHNGQQMVQLYEKGYGKDAAGIAMEAINFAREARIDIVLVDTAGRMQDNEPLMRALAKLIKVNDPDLVLFVGEALVGNEAVDQLVKFNQALADYSATDNPHLIDGIVLTKFDTIDDKVGAAISMTYITGQPIVFVGTGQTYTDLKSLNAKAVVHALMK
ncbi:signal recognition particle receptor subunit alpha homolog isoform X2 [Neocloeon triangulifer]|uniref:signal recognition particle receptor subunit alpha homolog isoform X2 n=1 Tax=Neocloeon triangulifer TaxID=2078957 RepID=UPI00286F5116|nr:signal recognition particle receptor subunit alpha homolog isoform X2 [Neocloeon triangulifer]